MLLIFVVGLAIILVALQTPEASLNLTAPAGTEINQVYFFQPTTLSISISALQGNATLLVQPVNYNSSSGSPVVNVSVIAQDIVTFSVPSRGYYVVAFSDVNGSIPAVSYVVDESGIPPDLLTAGIVLMGIAGILYLILLTSTLRIRMTAKIRK